MRPDDTKSIENRQKPSYLYARLGRRVAIWVATETAKKPGRNWAFRNLDLSNPGLLVGQPGQQLDPFTELCDIVAP
jgi:hypothetical protein